jgi:hypothetical protein
MSSHKIKKPTAVAVAIDCACFGFFTQSRADDVGPSKSGVRSSGYYKSADLKDATLGPLNAT